MKFTHIGSDAERGKHLGAVLGGAGRAAASPSASEASCPSQPWRRWEGRRNRAGEDAFCLAMTASTPLGGEVAARPLPPLSSARRGFTLIELLTVITIMAILAAFTIVVLNGMARTKYLAIARAEMNQIEAALDAYKSVYGVYPPSNANPASTYPLVASPMAQAIYPQLYYELAGVYPTNKGPGFVTMDNSTEILATDAKLAFGVDGFVNCCKGTGDDATQARNFLSALKQNRIGSMPDNGPYVTNLVTSVGGPAASYMPIPTVPNNNPFRYLCPGTNNPSSYDLWVQLNISGTKYLVCNWTAANVKNSPLP